MPADDPSREISRVRELVAGVQLEEIEQRLSRLEARLEGLETLLAETLNDARPQSTLERVRRRLRELVTGSNDG